jgi:hypothetical protein
MMGLGRLLMPRRPRPRCQLYRVAGGVHSRVIGGVMAVLPPGCRSPEHAFFLLITRLGALNNGHGRVSRVYSSQDISSSMI